MGQVLSFEDAVASKEAIRAALSANDVERAGA